MIETSKMGVSSSNKVVTLTGTQKEVLDRYIELLERFKWHGACGIESPKEVRGEWTASVSIWNSCD